MITLDLWQYLGLPAGLFVFGFVLRGLTARRPPSAPWCWRRQPPQPSGRHVHGMPILQCPPTPEAARVIHLLDDAARALSTYVWNSGQIEAQMSVAEHYLNRVRLGLAQHKRSNTVKIETTLDKVVISAAELQEIVKAHILRETGRYVEGLVSYELKNEGIANFNQRNSATAWCHLQPAPAAA